jgi:uncharacterized radical SAM superfamily Fe-S cluster-containing enzyme
MKLATRPYLIEEYTRTVCPDCFRERARRSDEPGVFMDGMLVSHGGSIWLRRFCREHGETESLYEEDGEIWRARRDWSAPTLAITPDRPNHCTGFPDGYRDGLPASHGQHTCILLLNVTERCNYGCPACYATARPPGARAPTAERPTAGEVVRTVETILHREGGQLGVLMLSGGEPTVRDDLPELIERVADLNVTRVVLNSNGRRIARDDRFLDFLRRHRRRLEVYLQFDGLRPATYQRLRGEDVTAEKQLALRRLNEAGVFTTLVMTVARGCNEEEVGDVIRLGIATPRCSGVAVQPLFGSGRAPGYDPRSRATPTGVLQRLEAQTGGLVCWTDFVPLPCSHRDCCDITYLVRGADDRWRSLPALVGRDELKRWIHVVANTITFDQLSAPVAQMLRSGTLQRVFSEQQKMSAPQLAQDLAWMCECIPALGPLLGGLWARVRREEQLLERAAEATFRITVKMFMDAHTFHEARLRQCCVHTGTFEADPRRYSFCWRWLFADATDTPGPAFLPVEGLTRNP